MRIGTYLHTNPVDIENQYLERGYQTVSSSRYIKTKESMINGGLYLLV